MAAELLHEIYRPQALVRVRGKAPPQITEGFASTENTNRVGRRQPLAGKVRGIRGRNQDPSCRSLWPEPVELSGVGEIIEHHEPRPAGLAKPAEETCSDQLGISRRVGIHDGDSRFHIGREHRRSVRGNDPDQQVYLPGPPQRLCATHRELSLATRTQPILCIVGACPRRLQRHGAARAQRRPKVRRCRRPGNKTIGKRGHRTQPDRPAHLPVRPSSAGHSLHGALAVAVIRPYSHAAGGAEAPVDRPSDHLSRWPAPGTTPAVTSAPSRWHLSAVSARSM